MITPASGGLQNSAYESLFRGILKNTMKRFEILFGLLKIPTDFFMTVLAFMLAYKLRLITQPIEGIAKPIDYSTLPTLEQYLLFSAKAGILLIIIFALGKMYSLKTTEKLSRESQKVLAVCGIWVMSIITYFFFARTFPFSRLAIIYSWALTLILVIGGRTLIHMAQRVFHKAGIGQRRLLFIGNNNIANEIAQQLRENPIYKIVGVVGEKNDKSNLKHLGSMTQLEYILKHHDIDETIQAKSGFSEKQDEEILEHCEFNQIDYRFVPDLLDFRRINVDIETIGNIPVISLKPTPLDGWSRVLKRGIDLIGATLGLIILSPIFLATAIAIKLDSKGPIIFKTLEDGSPVKRVGEKGKLFKFYKFRSMHPDTDHLRLTILRNQNIRKDGPLIKIGNDPRITRVGKFIRRYSIDELPQLLSVIKGDMSLVGPRPHLPDEVAGYKKQHHFVFNMKPGVTGLSQISGRSELTFEQETKLDRFYIENWSIWLDIKIIFKTIGVILKGYKE